MNKHNEQGQPHGPWEEYYRNGNLNCKGNYLNGEPHGIFEWYWFNGLLDVIYHIT